MASNHQQQNISATSFLEDPDAQEHFAYMDYLFKNGAHIQYTKEQEWLWRFIGKHYESMKRYYMDFFDLSLEESGEALEKYYYLEFLPGNRRGVPLENRDFLPNEYVIIGFLLYKIIFIDGYVELDSLTRLQQLIRQDNEDIKPGIYRALAKAKKINTTQLDDDKVDEIILKAMREFSKIGWIELDGDRFSTLPSFQRLPKLYGDYINKPELWQKQDIAS